MLKTIYMIEVINAQGELIIRNFARNKKLAEKIARPYKHEDPIIRKLQIAEWSYIDLRDVKGITEQEINWLYRGA